MKIGLAGLLLFVSVACAHAAETPRVYEEDFSLGVAGWTSLSTALHVASGGAVDGGGYLKAGRHNAFPGQHRITAEAVRDLWRGKIFVGHVQKKHYMNTDHVGILLYALLQLEGALGENPPNIEVLF